MSRLAHSSAEGGASIPGQLVAVAGGVCPMGGDHRLHAAHDAGSYACRRCHQTWLICPDGSRVSPYEARA